MHQPAFRVRVHPVQEPATAIWPLTTGRRTRDTGRRVHGPGRHDPPRPDPVAQAGGSGIGSSNDVLGMYVRRAVGSTDPMRTHVDPLNPCRRRGPVVTGVVAGKTRTGSASRLHGVVRWHHPHQQQRESILDGYWPRPRLETQASRLRQPPDDGQRARDRAAAVQWARALRARDDWAVLDTETTGGRLQEAIQIAVTGCDGRVLLDTLLRPAGPINPFAIAVHGITEAMVRDAPAFPAVYPFLCEALRGREILVYNAAFDRSVIAKECARHRLDGPRRPWTCAMRQAAPWFGDWDPAARAYKSRKLAGGDHSAAGDCRAVLTLIERMATG